MKLVQIYMYVDGVPYISYISHTFWFSCSCTCILCIRNEADTSDKLNIEEDIGFSKKIFVYVYSQLRPRDVDF